MIQEDKNLLLVDLSARLPYGVKILHTGWDYDSDTDFYVSVLEKNGAYVGYFSKEGNKIGEYAYYSKSEYKKFLEENEVKEVEEIDYEKLIVYMNNQEAIPVHAVKPLYIKRIEVLKK